jgi:hypothetical protein
MKHVVNYFNFSWQHDTFCGSCSRQFPYAQRCDCHNYSLHQCQVGCFPYHCLDKRLIVRVWDAILSLLISEFWKIISLSFFISVSGSMLSLPLKYETEMMLSLSLLISDRQDVIIINANIRQT